MNIKKRFLWSIHNLIAHPMLVLLPQKWGSWLHDITIPNNNKIEGKNGRINHDKRKY